MIPTHATEFDGDPAECVKWLGYARGVLQQMVRDNNPAVKSKHLFIGDAEIWITKNPNAIRIKSGGKLFCTSFNAGVDDGTQIYKAPYPPKTQGALIAPDDNFNGLILPSPDYSARTNYFVNDKETETVSWDYVNAVIDGNNRKFGKIAIQGIETDINWGLYLEPLVVGIIKPTDTNPNRQQLLVIYRNRVNYSGTGTTRYCAVYDYALDFVNQKIDLTLVSSFNLSAAGYGTKNYIGVLDDECKTVVYYDSGLKYLVLADDYLSVASTGEIFNNIESTLISSEEIESGNFPDSATMQYTYSPSETVASYVDVRGNTVSFCIYIIKTKVEIIKESWDAFGNVYYKRYDDIRTYGYDLAHWKNGVLTRREYKTGSYNRTSNRQWHNVGMHGYYSGSASYSQTWYLFLVYARKIGEVLFNEMTESASYTAISDSPAGWNVENQTAITKLWSKLTGELLTDSVSTTGNPRVLIDYSYTKSCILANINDEFSYIGNIKKKSKTILNDKILKIISVTNLPKKP